MKKVLLIGGLAMVALSSCKKTRSCECTTTYNGATTETAIPVEGTKSDAKTACSAYETNMNASNATYSALGVSYSASCEVK